MRSYINLSVKNCSGCTRDHRKVTAESLDRPTLEGHTHWFACPFNGSVVYVRQTPSSSKNSVVDNHVCHDPSLCLADCDRKHNVPNDFTASTIGQRKLPPDPDREVWTKEDPMVTALRTGLSNMPNKDTQLFVVANPKPEFKLPKENLSKEFIEKRISEQFDYCKMIIDSNYSPERKKELIHSAMGCAVNFALNVGTPETYLFLAQQIIKANIKEF